MLTACLVLDAGPLLVLLFSGVSASLGVRLGRSLGLALGGGLGGDLLVMQLLALLVKGWGDKPRDLTTVEVVEDKLSHTSLVGLTTLQKTTVLSGNKLQKLGRVLPARNLVSALKVLGLAALEQGRDELFRVGNVLDTDDTTEQNVCLGVLGTRWHNTGAVNQKDALHERNVLPDLGLTRNGGNHAHLLLAQGVDDGRLARVGVADKTDRNLLTVAVQGRELAEQVNQTTFTERVGDGGVECKGGVFFRQVLNPRSLAKLASRLKKKDLDKNVEK